jgi:cytochrome c-type biogenesis protein CcmE
VRYHGVKPANFEDAVSIVAIGRYDAAASEFAADKLLVKCPSKYQGIEDTETKTYS